MKKYLMFFLILLVLSFSWGSEYDYVVATQNQQFFLENLTNGAIFYNPSIVANNKWHFQLSDNYTLNEYRFLMVNSIYNAEKGKAHIGISFKKYATMRTTTFTDPTGEYGVDKTPYSFLALISYSTQLKDFQIGIGLNWFAKYLINDNYNYLFFTLGSQFLGDKFSISISSNIFGVNMNSDTGNDFPYRINIDIYYKWWKNNQIIIGGSGINGEKPFLFLANQFPLYKSNLIVGVSNIYIKEKYIQENNIGIWFAKINFDVSNFIIGLGWKSDVYGNSIDLDFMW